MKLLNILKALLSKSDPVASRFLRTWLPNPGSILFTLLVVGLVMMTKDVQAIPLSRYLTEVDAISNTISYQGFLTDKDGLRITDKLDMTFSLYTTESDEVTIGCEDHRAVQITDGIFLVELGGGESSIDRVAKCPGLDLIGPAQFYTNTLWLEIAIYNEDTRDKETMSPRQRLTSAPYANNADLLDGKDSNEFVSAVDGSTTAATIGELEERLSAIEEQSATEQKFFSGSTDPDSTDWNSEGDSLTIVSTWVDTSAAGFNETPNYFASIEGEDIFQTIGVSSIHEASPTGFKVYITMTNGGKVDGPSAILHKWHIKWIGVEQ